jgi:hypothetical protein
MKKLILVLALALTLPAIAHAEAKETAVATKKFDVTESGKRPLWRKILRGSARVATMGIVQAAPEVVQVNKPFSLQFDHDAIDTDGYRLKINGSIYRNVTVTQAWSAGVGKFVDVVLATKGSYTLVATAYNELFESDPSNALALSAQPGKPKAPATLRKSIAPLP